MASNNMSRGDRTPDVLVVGGGPGGTATAHWLAQRGLDVIVAEKKSYPRTKTCGDGLTPRAIRQLIDMGYDFAIPELHRIEGLRAYAGELVIELPWPEHSIYPNWGAAIRRADLDMQVAALAEKQGAVIRQNTEAVPLVEDGDLVAVELRENGDPSVDAEVVVPRVTVIADGSLSRFGRELQTFRRRDYPYGLALRGYYASTNSADPFMESQLDIRDRQGMALPGYGWVFPLGDGTINVGVGVLSTFKGAKGVNTSRVMDAFVTGLPDHWGITEDGRLSKPVGGKLPMSFSVGPLIGKNWLLVGDAAGAINPFNGEGIDYAYETGRLAASVIAETIAADDLSRLHDYKQALEDEFLLYNKVARAFTVAIGNPFLMRALTRTGLRSRPLMEWVLKVMANLLEPEDAGMSERVYHMIERVVELGPEPLVRT